MSGAGRKAEVFLAPSPCGSGRGRGSAQGKYPPIYHPPSEPLSRPLPQREGSRSAAVYVLALTALLITAQHAAAQAPTPQGVFTLPIIDEQGAAQHLAARLCRPGGTTPVRLAVINHGSPPSWLDAPRMLPASCASAPARWFLARGYAVLFALRRGFGASTGEPAGSTECVAPDFASIGLAEAHDVAAIVAAGQRLPGISPEGTVVLGQSTGGWAVLAYDTLAHPRLGGIVVMSGGRGGRLSRPGCGTDRLIAAAARFGAASRTPMLWIYPSTDRVFGPALAAALHAAFTRAGGIAQLEQPDIPGPDAHRMLYQRDGARFWGPLLAAYLHPR